MLKAIWILPAFAAISTAQTHWWMDEPIRLIQTNLRETDATLDAGRLVSQLVDFRANTLLFGMGGIAAYYPTRVPFHYPSPDLPSGRDLFGDVLRLAHARGIRVIGRFDLSKARKEVYDAHPEWFMRRANGEPVVYNGLYSACINGGYYREEANAILSEALDRYDVDGLFFNMFGNQSSDYSGNPIGPCQCRSCEERYRVRFHRDVPRVADAQYRAFQAESSREVAARIAALIHSKRPRAGFFTYIQQYTDGIMSESNTAVNRPLPLWPYSASDNVNRARGSEPDKMAVNLAMSFVDFPWRFATVPPGEIRLRLWENLANGGALALNMHGTMDQEDMQALDAARPVFRFAAAHQDLYAGQRNAARVLLLGSRQASYRGFFRLLSEQHIPFAVSDNLAWMRDPTRHYDLVISAAGTPAALEDYVRGGGRLLAAGAEPPPFAFGPPVRKWTETRGSYWRVRDRQYFPSLKETRLALLDGEYAEFAALPHPLLTLIPPSIFGPPEKVGQGWQETDKPGLLTSKLGRGEIAYLPWDIGALYYRLSLPAHSAIVADVIDHLLDGKRQIRTDAHPLVEISMMRQEHPARTLIHLINHTGHSDTAYFQPAAMRNIRIGFEQVFHSARAVSLDKNLPLTRTPQGTELVLPELSGYEVIVLEP